MSTPISQLLYARYGKEPSLPDTFVAEPLDALRAILSHRSIRHYSPNPLEPGLLELLVAAAESASTSSNLHTYSIIAVEDIDRKSALSEICGHQQHIKEAPLFLAFCADLARVKAVCDSQGSASAGLDYAEMFIMAVVDAALAAQNLVVAAESLGLGVCYIGGARNHPKTIAEFLSLPPKVFVTFGLTIGYPLDGAEHVKPRLPQSGILHREFYNADYLPTLGEYDEIIKQYNGGETGRQGRGWLTTTARRVATPEALGAERPNIRSFLNEVGLDLL